MSLYFPPMAKQSLSQKEMIFHMLPDFRMPYWMHKQVNLLVKVDNVAH